MACDDVTGSTDPNSSSYYCMGQLCTHTYGGVVGIGQFRGFGMVWAVLSFRRHILQDHTGRNY